MVVYGARYAVVAGVIVWRELATGLGGATVGGAWIAIGAGQGTAA